MNKLNIEDVRGISERGDAIIVLRHAGTIEFLKSMGIHAPVVSHADEKSVKGKNVIGVLPLELAYHADSVIAVSIDTPPEKRGVERDLEDIKASFKGFFEYKVI